ncbi:MAG: hypothetical protein ABMA13_23540 [Chthoniobacteraceae bacterium]
MKNARSFFFAALLGAIVPLCLAATANYFGVIKTDSNGLWIGTATADKIAFHGKAPIAQPTNSAQAALTDSTGGTANGTLADGLTVTAPAALTAAAPDVATAATVTGSLTGTTDGVLADVADIAISTSGGNTYADSAVNTAVNAAILSANLQLKELQTALNEVVADNVSLRTQLTAAVADMVAVQAKVASLVTDDGVQNDNDKELATLVNRLRLDLVNLGLIKGS